jgi:hypothetical protein
MTLFIKTPICKFVISYLYIMSLGSWIAFAISKILNLLLQSKSGKNLSNLNRNNLYFINGCRIDLEIFFYIAYDERYVVRNL